MIERYRTFSRVRIDRYLSKVSLVLLCIVMLYSMKIYVLWGRSYIAYISIFLFGAIRICFLKRTTSRKNLVSCFLCLLMYSVLDLFHLNDIASLLVYLVRHVFLVWLVILLSDDEKVELMRMFTKIYVVIVGFSLLSFALYQLGVELPYSIVKYEANAGYPDFKCYPFLLVQNEYQLINRFQSVFLEPGHLGMISALLLYVDGYRLKRSEGVILCVSILISLSLAAYMLLLVGFLLHYVMVHKGVLKHVVLSLMWILVVFVLALFYYMYNPDAAFSQRIVERLEFDEDKGFKGNNRTSASFDSYYEHFYQTSDCLIGVGPTEYKLASWGGRSKGGSSSYKVFIVQHGLIGLFLLILFFSVYTYQQKSKLLLGLLLLYIASFWQRPYALWEVELFLFISYAIYINKRSITNKIEKWK